MKYDIGKLQGKRILITGAGGLIGTALVHRFLELDREHGLGVQLTALCRDKEKAIIRFGDVGEEQMFDILAQDVCERLPEERRWDYIIHGASPAHPKAFARQPVETLKANIMGTMQLLEHIKRQSAQDFGCLLLISSGEIYGEPMEQKEKGFSELDMGYVDCMHPRACYPEGKRASEALCQAYYQEYGVPSIAARLGYVYGAGIQEDSTRADAQFIRKAAAGEDIVLKSAGTQMRSYCYIDDAIEALLLLLLEGEPGEAYNVADPNSICTVAEFAKALAKAAKVSVASEAADAQERRGYSKVSRAVLDTGKIERLGFQAKVSLEEGARRIMEYLSNI